MCSNSSEVDRYIVWGDEPKTRDAHAIAAIHRQVEVDAVRARRAVVGEEAVGVVLTARDRGDVVQEAFETRTWPQVSKQERSVLFREEKKTQMCARK